MHNQVEPQGWLFFDHYVTLWGHFLSYPNGDLDTNGDKCILGILKWKNNNPHPSALIPIAHLSNKSCH